MFLWKHLILEILVQYAAFYHLFINCLKDEETTDIVGENFIFVFICIIYLWEENTYIYIRVYTTFEYLAVILDYIQGV